MQSIIANEYSIHFSQNSYPLLNEFIEQNNYSIIFILVDSNTNEYCLPYFLPYLATTKTIEIIEIENGEEQKSIETCVEIWKILTELGGDRKSVIINLGGGVITDIGGFVASTFKRGIDFINIPTSLLAMVDASVGGKNGVDLGALKNQIGVINFPKMVVIDSEYLSNLPQNEMRSGLAEMLKHGLIYDKSYWEKFINLSEVDEEELDALIHRSIVIKNEIVSQDLSENGIRKALNFGHTLGHAIESYFLENELKTTLLHGEAIAVGMILESYISCRKNLISKAELDLIKTTLLHYFEKVIFEPNDLAPILQLLIHDKKNEYGKVQFCLLNSIGKTIYNQEATNELITESFDFYNS
ncbi:3-dehydroquinate synthase [Flavobacterium sp.]